MQKMDRLDRAILRHLANDARASVSEISVDVGLSQSACTRRIQALERSGAIAGYSARFGEASLGFRVTALVDITLNTQAEEVLRAFERVAGEVGGIVECMLVSGLHDYRLKIICRDLDDYERIHREHLGKLPGVANINSSFVLRAVETCSVHDAIFTDQGAK